MSPKATKYGYVFKYISAMVGIVVIGAAGVIFAFFNVQQADRDARDRISAFHVRSTNLAEQLRLENHALAESLLVRVAIDDMHSAAGVEQTRPDLNARLQTMEIQVGRLLDLQAQYGGAEFEATLQRIHIRLTSVASLARENGGREDQATAIAVLDLAISQLYRQHVFAEDSLLTSIDVSSERQTPLLFTIVAILVFSGFAAWIAIRLLKASIERRVSVEEALEASQQRVYQMQKLEALGLLVGGVAHDFNNLLTAILGQAGLLLDTADQTDTARESLEEIVEAASQASNLTRQLLTFSRPQDQERRVLNLGDLVLTMTSMLQRVLGEGVKLQVHAEPNLEPVEVDPTQMRQVILNLTINARDAMPRGGTLTVTIDNVRSTDDEQHAKVPEGRYVRMLVADTGVGMDEETQQRLFEPFFSTKPKTRGTGLGLATVHGIVTAAEGHIFVTSRPGIGSVFEVCLPASDKPLDSTERDEPAHEQIIGSETVLVVEDDQQIRKFITNGLGILGYYVVAAPSAAAGIEVCAVIPEAICELVGGTYQGDGTTCKPDPCSPP